MYRCDCDSCRISRQGLIAQAPAPDPEATSNDCSPPSELLGALYHSQNGVVPEAGGIVPNSQPSASELKLNWMFAARPSPAPKIRASANAATNRHVKRFIRAASTDGTKSAASAAPIPDRLGPAAKNRGSVGDGPGRIPACDFGIVSPPRPPGSNRTLPLENMQPSEVDTCVARVTP